MPAPSDPLPLAAEFPPATRDQWIELVTGVLRRSGLPEDADPVAALSSTTYDGISVRPLYTAADAPPGPAGTPGSAPYLRGATADGPTLTGWDVRQRHADPDPARLRAGLLGDLEAGVTSVWLVLGEAGLPVADLPAALAGVYLDLAPVALDAGGADGRGRRGVPAAGRRARSRPGRGPRQPRRRPDRTARPHRGDRRPEPAGARSPDHPNLRVATVDATVYHDAGASDADELAVATAVGVAYLRALTDAGLDVEAALDAAGVPVRGERGPVRLHRQAARGPAASGPGSPTLCAAEPARGQRQHAVTSAAMMTRRDPWVNMLRTTVACFAAGGRRRRRDHRAAVRRGARAAGRPSPGGSPATPSRSCTTSRAWAGSSTPAGGSWYVEALTDELAARRLGRVHRRSSGPAERWPRSTRG